MAAKATADLIRIIPMKPITAGEYDGNSPERSCGSLAWTHNWHLWKVIVPRRSITGRLVWGTVWRRIQGRQWVYKKFTEYPNDGGA